MNDTVSTNEKLLEKALMWALDNGASLTRTSKTFNDSGCGCCAGTIVPPDEISDVVFKVRRKLAKQKNKQYKCNNYEL